MVVPKFICLDLDKMLGKNEKYSLKWWFHGALLWQKVKHPLKQIQVSKYFQLKMFTFHQAKPIQSQFVCCQQTPTQKHKTRGNIRITSWWLNQPLWKNMLVKMDSSSPNRDEHKKCLKPPPRLPFDVAALAD